MELWIMDVPVTIHLPDDIYQRAKGDANLLGKDVADVLAETIALSSTDTHSQVRPSQNGDRLSELVDKVLQNLPDEAIAEAVTVMEQIIEFYTDRIPQSELSERPSKVVIGRIVSVKVRPPIVLES